MDVVDQGCSWNFRHGYDGLKPAKFVTEISEIKSFSLNAVKIWHNAVCVVPFFIRVFSAGSANKSFSKF